MKSRFIPVVMRSKALLIVLFVMTLAIVLGSKSVPTVAQARLSDVRGHWAQTCIESLSQRQIINGYPEGTFRPEATVTRAEYAVMVGKSFPQMKLRRSPVDFLDVPPNHWAYGAIQRAYQAGFLSGYPGGRFNPTEAIARVQAVGALAGGLGYKTQQPQEQILSVSFTDASQIPAYATGAIAAAADNGMVVNYPNLKQLRPNQPITRAELAATLCRAQPETAQLVPAQYVAASRVIPDRAVASAGPIVPPAVSPASPSQPSQPQARSEIRAAWITNVDSEVMFDHGVMVNAMRELAQFNFNTLYPTVWNWGYTQYPSEVARREIGYAVDPRVSGLQNRDFLAEMVAEAHQQGVAVLPWFEFGFMITAESELRKAHPDWITQRRDGNPIWLETIYQRAWLNPFKPEVQQFIQDLVLELVTKYDIDGIQFDDHFGLPYEFGYDDYTVALYQREHKGMSPPADPRDAAWVRWRANKITEFTTRLFNAVKARKPHVLFTLSPNNYDFSLNHSLQDWLTWERQGLIEELVLQAYRDDLASFTGEMMAPEVQAARRHIPVAIGILSGLKDRPVPIRQVQDQIQAVRRAGFEGVSFFFYETMWNLSGESRDTRKAIFQNLFPTKSERPNIRQGWVPLT